MQKTLELPQVEHIERIVDVTVVIPHEVPSIKNYRRWCVGTQSQYLDRVVDVPVAMKRQTSLILKDKDGRDSPDAVY